MVDVKLKGKQVSFVPVNKKIVGFIAFILKSFSFTLSILLLVNSIVLVSPIYAEVYVKDAKARKLALLEEETAKSKATEADKDQRETQITKSIDRNRSRYFVGPSNLSLKSGESYFSQGVMSTYGRGLSDDLSLHLRFTSLVFFAYPISVASLQYSFDYATDWRGGVGIAMMPWDGLITYVYKSVTYGDEAAHVTLSIGQPLNSEDGTIQFTRFLVSSFSGNIKLSKSIHFITENWLLYMLNSQSLSVELMHSLGFRFQGEQFAFDLGAFNTKDSGRILDGPWFEFTWNFE
ncbi:MAG: hypothetical protein CMH49_10500 [Myxococcales bacterium]|nr:hypothetical protein [Myxococcales bacterium]